MGLDMFLIGVYTEDGETCRQGAIYWRKANAIHNWFVANVQGGEDNCQPHHLGREKLVELKGLCKEVLEDNTKAAELLPTRAGFFFGSTEYDGDYYFDLKYTIEKIDEVLEDNRFSFFEYCSWW